MPSSTSLNILLRIRRADEGQMLQELQLALVELQRLEEQLRSVSARQRAGRTLATAGIMHGDTTERIAGQEELRIAHGVARVLMATIATAELQVNTLRAKVLEKRIERRQVETLLATLQEREDLEARRKEQQMLDDWHRVKQSRIRAI